MPDVTAVQKISAEATAQALPESKKTVGKLLLAKFVSGAQSAGNTAAVALAAISQTPPTWQQVVIVAAGNAVLSAFNTWLAALTKHNHLDAVADGVLTQSPVKAP